MIKIQFEVENLEQIEAQVNSFLGKRPAVGETANCPVCGNIMEVKDDYAIKGLVFVGKDGTTYTCDDFPFECANCCYIKPNIKNVKKT